MTGTQEAIEELLELCWTAAEDGLVPLNRDALPKQLLCFLPEPIEPHSIEQQQLLDEMVQKGLLASEGRKVWLTALGKERASEIVRRHRLAEVLLRNVLAVSEESMESTACQFEHLLNAEVTTAVCTFLGHPPSCPHGRAIPKGSCCEEALSTVGPIIVPLSRLALGQQGTVALVHSRRPDYLQRLSAFGLAPGAVVRLRQVRPALVLQIGQTEVALDSDAAEEIYVTRHALTRA